MNQLKNLFQKVTFLLNYRKKELLIGLKLIDENSTEGSKDEWEKISQTNENNLEENKELTDTDLESVKKLDDWDDWDN